MEYILKVNASAVSRIGKFCADNEDNFYVDGRFIYDREVDNIQVSVENSGPEYLFAVSDSMDREIPEMSSSISLVKELKKLQDRFIRRGKEIELKLEEMSECVEEVSNLIYSTEIKEEGKDGGKAAFAGLLISGNKAAVMNISNCRVYLLRDGSLKLLSTDYRKTERLLKMGIITGEQAEKLSDHLGSSDGSVDKKLKKSQVMTVEEGDVFLLCTNGLTDVVDEDRIYDILSAGGDAGHISHKLVAEAVKNGGEDNMTALVVSIEKIEGEDQPKTYVKSWLDEEDDEIDIPRRVRYREGSAYSSRHEGSTRLGSYRERQSTRPSKASIKRQKAIQRLISTVAACLVIIVSLFGAYKLWNFLSRVEKDENTVAQNTNGESDQNFPEDQEYMGETETGLDEPTDETAGEGDAENSFGEEFQFPIKYTVQKGDTLYQLSKKFYNDPTKYNLIMEANNIQNANQIQVGQVLTIPAP